mgnify:CR=1 FL=1
MFERVKSLFQAVKPKSVIRQIQARFDAAQTTHDNVKHWSAADHFSADQEARPEIRQDLPGLWLDGLVRGWQSQREEAPCKEITVYSYKYLIINALPTGLRVVMRFITRCAQGMRHKPPSQRRKHHDHEPEPAQRPSRIGAAYGKTTAAKQTGIRVKLINTDGNAFSILGVVLHALRKGGCGEDFIKAFMVEATRSDYQHLLAVIADTVEIE